MSVLKNLKSIFIVEGDNPTAKTDKNEPEEPVPPGTANPSRNDPKGEAQSSSAASGGERDNKIIETLFKAIESNNLEGFDYLEFKQAVKGLEKMVTDEATRFKSAFSTASTMGVTLDKLVETADYYVNVLDKEREKFVRAAKEQTTSLVENRKQEMQHLLKDMADKKAMIDKLTKELANSEERLSNIQKGIDNATVKIDQTKKNFDVSFNHLREQISEDIAKMKDYLK